MIAFQNPWIKPLIYFFSISTATLGLFWPEIIQTSMSFGQVEYTGFRFGEVASQNITGYALKGQRNNAEDLDAAELVSINSAGSAGYQVTLRLDNYGRPGTNDWPTIKVIYRDAGGRAVRTESLTPSMYMHTGSLARTQTIELTLKPRAGEPNAKFEPFYPNMAQSS